MRLQRFLGVLLVFATVGASRLAAASSLLVNGSFEFGPPPFGVHDIDIPPGSTGGIQQSFATTQGQVYRVTFDVSGNPEGEPRLKCLRVTVDGAQHQYVFNSIDQTIDALKWRRMTFAFVADDSSATLSFQSQSENGNAYGALIDNVSVVEVGAPED